MASKLWVHEPATFFLEAAREISEKWNFFVNRSVPENFQWENFLGQVPTESLRTQLLSSGHWQSHTNGKGTASTAVRRLFSVAPARSPRLMSIFLINYNVHIIVWMSTKTMHPKSKLQSLNWFHLSQINFTSSICFSHHGNFSKIRFSSRAVAVGRMPYQV